MSAFVVSVLESFRTAPSILDHGSNSAFHNAGHNFDRLWNWSHLAEKMGSADQFSAACLHRRYSYFISPDSATNVRRPGPACITDSNSTVLAEADLGVHIARSVTNPRKRIRQRSHLLPGLHNEISLRISNHHWRKSFALQSNCAHLRRAQISIEPKIFTGACLGDPSMAHSRLLHSDGRSQHCLRRKHSQPWLYPR